MRIIRTRPALIAVIFATGAWVLLAAGVLVGWVYPALASLLGWGRPPPPSASHIDPGVFLSAELTALSVLIAVVIGFNVTLLQLASQAHSLRVSGDILRGLLPFLGAWTGVMIVTLAYFLVPVDYTVEIWQEVFWFLAVTALMIEYLWKIPQRLTGEYVAEQALGDLAGAPIAGWESRNGHGVLQGMMAGAIQRGDLATTRMLMAQLGDFLATNRDLAAEMKPGYDRRRYRALRNLFIAAAQQAETAPNALAYTLGTAEAGYLLSSVAIGLRADDHYHPLFSSLLRQFEGSPGRLVALLTGIRHALLRPLESAPLLLRYWEVRTDWPEDDPRLIADVAHALAVLYVEAEQRLAAQVEDDLAQAKVKNLIADLFRTLKDEFFPAAQRAGERPTRLATVFLAALPERIAALRALRPALVPSRDDTMPRE